MRNYDQHVENLHALAEQEGSPVGMVSIKAVATMLLVRDELIYELKRVIEDDVREQRVEAREARRFHRMMEVAAGK